MAEIFLARQTGMEGLERTVVIKRILPHRARDAEFVTMFLDEARIVAGLNHPNVAQIYDLGKEDESFFLVMEYVQGPDLGKLLDTIYESGGRGLPLRVALPILIGMCEALHYIHEKRDETGMPLGIVHRDINPQNVVISYEGAVKLIDFGIAKAKTKVYETRTGVIKGTYGYMAPEQLTRKAPIDRRSDVFALGVLLYESILGVHPFEASDEVALLGHIVRGDYKRPRAVRGDFPEPLEKLILGCLAPRPDQRIPDARTVQRQLEDFMADNHLIVSMARLGDFVREVVPEPAEKRDEKPRSAPRAAPHPVDGPTPQHLRLQADADSVIAALAGHENDETVARLETPLFPDEDESFPGRRRPPSQRQFDSPPATQRQFEEAPATQRQFESPPPTQRRPPSERRLPDRPPRVSPAPAPPLTPTALGYAVKPVLVAPQPLLSPAPSSLGAVLETSGPVPVAAAAVIADAPTMQRTEDSVSVATVLDRPGGLTSKMTLPPVSNIDRLAGPLLPVGGSAWSSPTVRGIALVLLAALGGAVLAATGVALLSDDGDAAANVDASATVARADPAPAGGMGSRPASAAAPPDIQPRAPVPTTPAPTPAPTPTQEVPAPPPVPPPETKSLEIRSTPSAAHIAINGEEREERTPAIITLPPDSPDSVTVKVWLVGYQMMEREVEVITGAAVFELQKNRGTRRVVRRRPSRGRSR